MSQTTHPKKNPTNHADQRSFTNSPNPLDIIVLFCLSCFTILIPPQTHYLSYKFGLISQMSSNIFGNVLTGLSTILILAYFHLIYSNQKLWAEKAKLLIICLFTVIYMILPTISDIYARHDMGLKLNGEYVSAAHDGGVLQTEAAIRFLLQGISPYSADYHGTEMENGLDSDKKLWKSLGFTENPSYNYYSYPPLTILMSTPFYLVFNRLFNWYDQRLIYLLTIIALGVIGYKLPSLKEWKLPFMTLLILNPLSANYFYRGMNDILCLTFILWALLLISRKFYKSSAAILALACMTKQFAWILVPFYIAYVYTQIDAETSAGKIRRTANYLWPLFVISGLIFFPFLIWDPIGFFNSLITANAMIYPFRAGSLGVSNFLIFLKIIENNRDTFPIFIFYVTIIFPVCICGIYRIIKTKSLSSMVIWYVSTLLPFLFFSKHFAQNYFNLCFTLMIVSIMWSPQIKVCNPPGNYLEE